MSKIYDALERRDLGVTDAKTVSSPTLSGNISPDIEVYGIDAEMSSLYYTIATTLPDRDHRSILFVGPRSKEGVSTIARELAKTVTSRLDKKALLVDCQGGCDGFTCRAIDPSVSLEDILERKAPLDGAIYPVNGGGMSVLPFFLWADSPRVQISLNENGSGFWNALNQQFDLTIIDYPQELFANGPSMMSMVDGVIIVVEAEKTRWQAALGLKEKIVSEGGNVLGVVFNKRRHYIPQFIYDRL